MADLDPLKRRVDAIERALDGTSMRTALTRVGMSAKRELSDEGMKAIGDDLRMSGWKRGGKLNSGFDLTSDTSLAITPRPYGLWMVVERGRRETTAPRRGRPRTVVLRTPFGPRTYSHERPLRIGATRGRRSLTIARERNERTAPTQVFQSVTEDLRKAWR
jgi:hypothetical protein